MLVLLVTSIVALPLDRALADQVMEIPQQPQAAAVEPEPAPIPSARHADRAPEIANAPLPPDLGGIGDYMHQPGDKASAAAGYPPQPGFSGGYASNPSDPHSNSSQLLTAALVGGAIIGLIALSNYSAHHQRHR